MPLKDESRNIELASPRASINNDVFGEIPAEGPNYRDIGWMGTFVLMLKTQVGLGVLSIPYAFDKLGLIPGILCLLGVALIATWGQRIVGVFKRNHADVYSIVDTGEKIGGRPGRELMGFAFMLYWICVAASGMSGISTALNAITLHGACTAIFVALAAFFAFAIGSIRTLGNISWLAWIGGLSIFAALFTLTVAVGLQGRPTEAPKIGPYVSNYKLIGNPTFYEGMAAINSLVFAYSGTPAFFAIISEMRDPRQYKKAMLTCQCTMTGIYLVVGIVVYYYCGTYVSSPALGSAGPLLKRICYGLALPGLMVSTCLLIHYPSKYIFVRALRDSQHLVSNSTIHWITWLSCTFGVTIVGYVIASTVPNFGSLVSLVGALLATLMSFQPMGAMWLHDNWNRRERGIQWRIGVSWSVFVIVIGTYIMIAGSYTAIVSIIDSYTSVSGTNPWSCADKSNSVDLD
ncbi:putative amino acid transporter [Aaosphaeria arxii CBS 175.79]|uniref:Putative amino acid transporter n=1 Tax=Aaosphaeria arxii CBS 175.79 TaxID=1450172 RepID=A0A6A5XP22_9PLEO|nr:putative amino acid transporter [Aaosphaeria arxii CBS 175.79]KAF2014104.1 putative amino acid transporter [Aaosphaeria arxii CBS 175.79]